VEESAIDGVGPSGGRFPPDDLHSPRSTESRSSCSSASSFVAVFFTEVFLRGLPARDDRLQEDRLLVLDEQHQKHVALAPDDEDTLGRNGSGVDRRARCGRQILELDAALRLELSLGLSLKSGDCSCYARNTLRLPSPKRSDGAYALRDRRGEERRTFKIAQGTKLNAKRFDAKTPQDRTQRFFVEMPVCETAAFPTLLTDPVFGDGGRDRPMTHLSGIR
jgi:hypothetical protein